MTDSPVFAALDKSVDERLYLQSVARALDVLECFEDSPRVLSLNEIAKMLDINKSAAQRTVNTLLARNYLAKAEGAGYQLGHKVLDCAFNFLRNNPLVERATPVLSELRKTSSERVDLSLFDFTSLIYALRFQSKRETFYATLVGRRLPVYNSAGGRSCLAHLDDALVREILQRQDRRPVTPKSIVEIDAIMQKIAETRQNMFALSVEEALIGEVVVAAAIRSPSGHPIGAVHMAGSLGEWTPEAFQSRFAPLVVEAARALSI